MCIRDRYYVMYALNKDGQKGLYQYDTVDKTYQRYLKHSGSDDTADKASPKGLWGKILQFIEDFLDILVIVAIAASVSYTHLDSQVYGKAPGASGSDRMGPGQWLPGGYVNSDTDRA